MNKKFLTSLCVVLFISIFSWLYGHDFFEYFTQSSNYQRDFKQDQQDLEQFSLQDIPYISDLDLYITPSLELESQLLTWIDASQEHVMLEVYLFTKKSVQQALIRAHNRWVQVQVILEKNPYKAYNMNNKHFQFLQDSGIDIVWSNPKNYSLNHAKFFIIDDRVIVSTGNMTHSLFTKNRDLIVVSQDTEIQEQLVQLFQADFNGQPISIAHPNLVISPDNSRHKLKTLIEQADTSLKMYFQYLQDESMQDVLISRAQEGLDIELIVSKNTYFDQAQQMQMLESQEIKISYTTADIMHAKAILVDEQYLFIGSVNFSSYSFDNNREIGLVFKNDEVVEDFLDIFEKDF